MRHKGLQPGFGLTVHGSLLTFLLLAWIPGASAGHGGATSGPWHSDVGTVNVTQTSNIDNADLRGFDPSTITGPNDPFPDTSRPCCLDGSTQFGHGLAAGSSGEAISQNCNAVDPSEPAVSSNQLLGFGTGTIQAIPESSPFPVQNLSSCDPQVTGNVFQTEFLFQQSRNGLISRPQRQTANCDGLGTGQRCNEITFGFLQQVQEQNQTMDLSFAIRSLTDADGNLIGAAEGTFTQTIDEGGVQTTCSGTFTFDEQNGFVMTSGPLHAC